MNWCHSGFVDGIRVCTDRDQVLDQLVVASHRRVVQRRVAPRVREVHVGALLFDEPFGNSSAIPTYFCLRAAKESGVTAMVAGDGGDELFAGYHHHFIAKWNNLLKRGKYFEVLWEISKTGKSISNPALFFVKEKFKSKMNPGSHFDFLLKKNL